MTSPFILLICAGDLWLKVSSLWAREDWEAPIRKRIHPNVTQHTFASTFLDKRIISRFFSILSIPSLFSPAPPASQWFRLP